MATETVTLHVPAIHCDGCLRTVRRSLEEAGAEFESGDTETKHITVRYDNERLNRAALVDALEMVGFIAEDDEDDEEDEA